MLKDYLETLDPKKNIIIKGAKVHNLKNISLAIPSNKFVVITGLSGSGKSSLAFDTLYAEGQRRYVESLSSYARQFLGRLDKPEVDYIKGISPAVAIEQKVITRNSRSTVGTSTEVYDYLKLFFARIGKTFSPISGEVVTKHQVDDVLDFVKDEPLGNKFVVLAPITKNKERSLIQQLTTLKQNGYARIKINDKIVKLDDKSIKESLDTDKIWLVVDRLSVSEDESDISRFLDSAEIAFFEGHGFCQIEMMGESNNSKLFSNNFELDGMEFEEPSTNFFSFNNPLGACKVCEGFGSVIGIDTTLVIPNENLSIFEDAVACWKGEKMSEWKKELVNAAHNFDFPIHKPINQLSKKNIKLLWSGNKHFKGLTKFFKMVEENTYKIQYRVMLSRYRGKTPCSDCEGTRLRKDANYVKINNHSITDLAGMPLDEALLFFNNIDLTEREQKIAKHLLTEIKSRLHYLNEVGLGYLNLSRHSNTLSGGESQRINLATSLGNSLVGSMYILDEPSIGLHPKDTHRLIKVLTALRDLGNTVIVVEHDEEIMRSADYIIDMGPRAGTFGGEVVFEGDHDMLLMAKNSLTADYLTGKLQNEKRTKFRKWKSSVIIENAHENNLKNIDVEFPLKTLTCIVGVSGSGKSSLVQKILYPALKHELLGTHQEIGKYTSLSGYYSIVKDISFINQNPIGKSSRSNPVTYVKGFDDIRALFANLPLSKSRLYKPSHFSYNVQGGRCDNCDGEGMITVSMQFMADIKLLCDTCKGKRYKTEVLDVKFHDKSIADILNMTVDNALQFFEDHNDSKSVDKLIKKIAPLEEVGLGYVQLGQSSSTLSGGEAQRVKLASYLSKGSNAAHTLFIFDEPTTGLHFDDVKKLLKSFNALIEQGHSIIVVEHNKDIINASDWVIELGPEGGKNGGQLLYSGTPDKLIGDKKSVTAEFL